jgi:hypothetical protein
MLSSGPNKIDWKYWDGDKYARTVTIDGAHFWAEAIRTGRGGKWIAGWNVMQLDRPGGYLVTYVAKELHWREVDAAVYQFLGRK